MVMFHNNVIPGSDLHCAGFWHFGNYRNIFLRDIGGDIEKILPSERWALLALCHMVNPTLVIALRS